MPANSWWTTTTSTFQVPKWYHEFCKALDAARFHIILLPQGDVLKKRVYKTPEYTESFFHNGKTFYISVLDVDILEYEEKGYTFLEPSDSIVTDLEDFLSENTNK